MRIAAFLCFLVAFVISVLPAHAGQGRLTVNIGGTVKDYDVAALLARPDTATITVPNDASYHRAMSYRAVPLLALLGAIDDTHFDTLEARATDGFIAQIPLALIAQGARGGAVAWVAVEDPSHPWPPAAIAGRTVSPGPFYLVWEGPERSGVAREQWPFRLASLTPVESPLHRWPQLAPPAGSDAMARTGLQVFLSSCTPCHRMKGGGEAHVGPDLGQPMNPTQYLTDAGLRAIIRNPAAVRTWPEQHMEGFDETALSDGDLDALVAYLHAMTAPSASAAGK